MINLFNSMSRDFFHYTFKKQQWYRWRHQRHSRRRAEHHFPTTRRSGGPNKRATLQRQCKDGAKCDWLWRQQSLLVLFIFENAHRLSDSTKARRQFLSRKNIFHQSSRDGMARIRNVEKRHLHQASALFLWTRDWLQKSPTRWICSRDAICFSILR